MADGLRITANAKQVRKFLSGRLRCDNQDEVIIKVYLIHEGKKKENPCSDYL
jgi:hypothetical protein